jgi:C4-type Zn-finger protein
MCVTDIPHFKEIIIMSFLCDECGNRTVEVKGGGAVPDHGTKTTLRVEPGEETLGVGTWKVGIGEVPSGCLCHRGIRVPRSSALGTVA